MCRVLELSPSGYHAWRRPGRAADATSKDRRGQRPAASRSPSTKTATRDQRAARVAPDLVDRDFSAAGAYQLCVADIVYVRTWSGFLSVAVVKDAWSRRVVQANTPNVTPRTVQ